MPDTLSETRRVMAAKKRLSIVIIAVWWACRSVDTIHQAFSVPVEIGNRNYAGKESIAQRGIIVVASARRNGLMRQEFLSLVAAF